MSRQIVLDTETTGLEVGAGNRVIEIGCVEIVDRRLTGNNFHQYLQPDRESEAGALEVHGITSEFLADKPRFPDVAQDFLSYVRGAEVIIHNAPFDLGFLDKELELAGLPAFKQHCDGVIDSLILARKKHPGARANLDALCTRYEIDNSHRDKHGALLDAEILADVYLAMTGGQTALLLSADSEETQAAAGEGLSVRRLAADRPRLAVIRASDAELQSHDERLQAINKSSGGKCVWLNTSAL